MLERPSLRHALACLRRTTPLLNLTYPHDAWAHFDEVHRALAPWLQSAPGFRRHGASGYGGPWIENVWIDHFEQRATSARQQGRPLYTAFGPYIPLLIPFTDHWVRHGYKYPPGLVQTLLGTLRASVAYVTVNQNDEGLTGKDEIPMERIPNVLVLSAGGYGHVPVPLLKQTEALRRAPPIAQRALLISYVGSLDNAPADFRRRVSATAIATAAQHGFHYKVGRGLPARWSAMMPRLVERAVCYLSGYEEWRGVMAASRTSLCPRGFGRSSYHLAETIQMGRVPVYIYSDTAWLPYERLFRRSLGYVANLAELPALLISLRNTSNGELERRERMAARVRRTHYTLDGVMEQIARFLLTPKRADLHCRQLPISVRDA